MKNKPASRRKRASAAIGICKGYISICPGENPYLWIGETGKCFGVVRDNHVKKLRDMCNEILDRRELENLSR